MFEYRYQLSDEELAGLEHELARANKVVDENNARRQAPVDRDNRKTIAENERRKEENKRMAAEDAEKTAREAAKPEGRRVDVVPQKPFDLLPLRKDAPKDPHFTLENYLDQHVQLILRQYVHNLANAKRSGPRPEIVEPGPLLDRKPPE